MSQYTGNERNYALKLQHHKGTCQLSTCKGQVLQYSEIFHPGWTGTSVQLMGAQAFSLGSDLTISNKLKNILHF